MTPSPVIYLSAPTQDLDSVRRHVTDLLVRRGCKLLLPEIGSNGAEVDEIRRQIQSSDMVIQIIGYRSTPFLEGLPPAREMTYLHALEGMLAAKLNKPIHPIFLTEDYPTDEASGQEEDDPELSERHRYWREFMRSDHLLYIPANKSELTSHIQRLHLGPFNASAVATAYGGKSGTPSLSLRS